MGNDAAVKLKAWRVGEDLTQAQAARRFGVTRMTWFRWENGEIQPRSQTLTRLCTAISGLRPDDFFYIETERQAA
jgi:transcriptional regulator with XRE-family HTH domain